MDSLHAVVYADVDLAEDLIQLPRSRALRLPNRSYNSFSIIVYINLQRWAVRK